MAYSSTPPTPPTTRRSVGPLVLLLGVALTAAACFASLGGDAAPQLALTRKAVEEEMAGVVAGAELAADDKEGVEAEAWWGSITEGQRATLAARWAREVDAHPSAKALNIRNMHHYEVVERRQRTAVEAANRWDEDHPGQSNLNPLRGVDGIALGDSAVVDADVEMADAEKNAAAADWWSNMSQGEKDAMAATYNLQSASATALNIRNMHHYEVVEKKLTVAVEAADQWDRDHPGQRAFNPLRGVDGVTAPTTEKEQADIDETVAMADAEKNAAAADWWSNMSQGEKDAMAATYNLQSASATALNIRNMHHYEVVEKKLTVAVEAADQWDRDHPGQRAFNPLRGVDGVTAPTTEKEQADIDETVAMADTRKNAAAADWWSNMSQGEKDAMADKWDVRSASATALNIRNMHHYMVVLKLEAKAARVAHQWDLDHPGESQDLNPLKGVDKTVETEVVLSEVEKSDSDLWWSGMSDDHKREMAHKWTSAGPGSTVSGNALNIRNMHHYMVVLKLEAKAAREAEQWDKDHPGEHAENPLKGVTSHETAEVSLAASEKSAEAWWSEKTDHQREELAAEWKSTGPGAHVSSNALNIRNMHHYGVILKLEAKAAKAAHAWDVEHPGHEVRSERCCLSLRFRCRSTKD